MTRDDESSRPDGTRSVSGFVDSRVGVEGTLEQEEQPFCNDLRYTAQYVVVNNQVKTLSGTVQPRQAAAGESARNGNRHGDDGRAVTRYVPARHQLGITVSPACLRTRETRVCLQTLIGMQVHGGVKAARPGDA